VLAIPGAFDVDRRERTLTELARRANLTLATANGAQQR
jgi:hypothetical protein